MGPEKGQTQVEMPLAVSRPRTGSSPPGSMGMLLCSADIWVLPPGPHRVGRLGGSEPSGASGPQQVADADSGRPPVAASSGVSAAG